MVFLERPGRWKMFSLVIGSYRQMVQLPETGYVRLTQILGKPATPTAEAVPPLIPIARSTWWAGVKSGRFPQPVRGLGPRITAWRAEDIRALIESLNGAATGSDRGNA